MSHRSDMGKLIKKIQKTTDCSVERTGSGHWKITTPSGATVFAAFSPRTGGGGIDATIRKLRKAGVRL